MYLKIDDVQFNNHMRTIGFRGEKRVLDEVFTALDEDGAIGALACVLTLCLLACGSSGRYHATSSRHHCHHVPLAAVKTDLYT